MPFQLPNQQHQSTQEKSKQLTNSNFIYKVTPYETQTTHYIQY